MARKAVETPEITRNWGFFLDGSFTDEGNHHRQLTESVRALVRARRLAEISPKQAISSVSEAFLDAFPHRDQWATISDPDFWPSAGASTSAEASVKYARRGLASTETSQRVIPWSESQEGS